MDGALALAEVQSGAVLVGQHLDLDVARPFDEPLDGIVYASFLALGFSFVENLHYLQFVSTTEAFARGFAAPIVHIVFASVWAYPIALARLENRSVWLVVHSGWR